MFRVIVIILLAVFGCEAGTVRIAVASSMQKPMKEIASLFNVQHPDCEAQVIPGSSGKLTAQIMNGAPYDLFFSADMSYPEYLSAQEKTAVPVYSFAEGSLVLWMPRFEKSNFLALTNDSVKRIAIANPRQAPYGRAAVESLKTIGMYEEVKDKLVYAENVAQVMHFLKSGGAEAGFVAASTFPRVLPDGKISVSMALDSHDPIQHGLAVISNQDQNKCVVSFLSFIKGEHSVRIFESYGFKLSRNEQP